ncbi:MAG: hypothetical protein ACRDIL_22005 [Candidatus Limnocylindrales bacterium]
MSDSQPGRGLLGLLGVGMVVCCGIPVLLGAGIAFGAAGFALGSGLVVAAGIAVGVAGWRRHQAGTPSCDRTAPGGPSGLPGEADSG